MVDIYKYYDYREFLRDFIPEEKKKNSALSHRFIHQRLGISPSSGFIANVLSGKQHFTMEQAVKLAEILGLSPDHTLYFKTMLSFARAKSIDEQNRCFKAMNSMRKRKLKKLSEKQLSVFNRWYNVVILELLMYYRFKDDYKALARMLDPPIKPMEAKYAIRELEGLGLIKKDREGYYVKTNQVMSTGDEILSYLVKKFQITMTDLEKRAIEHIPAEVRDISGLTLTLCEEDFARVKAEIQAFRKRMLEIARGSNDPDRVYRCNFKIFPVTQKAEKAS
jgi:uncharacterized protein (TIGR02147 family)